MPRKWVPPAIIASLVVLGIVVVHRFGPALYRFLLRLHGVHG